MKYNNQILTPQELCKHLVVESEQVLLDKYMEWIKLLFLRGVHQKYFSEKTFNTLYRAVSRPWSEKKLLGYLQKEFIKENLSLSLLLEPLDGFEWLSKNHYPLDLTTSSPILLQIVNPLSRLIAVLNKQHPPFYQPFANLMCIYIFTYLLDNPQWENMLKSVRITVNKKAINDSLPLLFNEAKFILPTVQGLKFKINIAYWLGLYTVISRKRSKNTAKKINFFDYVNAFLYGLWYIISIRSRPLKVNRL